MRCKDCLIFQNRLKEHEDRRRANERASVLLSISEETLSEWRKQAEDDLGKTMSIAMEECQGGVCRLMTIWYPFISEQLVALRE